MEEVPAGALDIEIFKADHTAWSKKLDKVVMMLAGFGSTNHSIAAWSPWKPNTVELFDRLIARGECGPAVLVLTDELFEKVPA